MYALPLTTSLTPAMHDFLMGASGIVCAFLVCYALLNAMR